jgi:hypothetical protein
MSPIGWEAGFHNSAKRKYKEQAFEVTASVTAIRASMGETRSPPFYCNQHSAAHTSGEKN